MANQDEPQTPEDIVEHARLVAQAQGKVMLAEMIEVLDEEIARRCQSAETTIKTYGDDCWGWEVWGRRTHVLESTLSFLRRIDNDVDARTYLASRLRREVIRDGVPVDGGGGREAAQAGGEGLDVGQDR